MIGAALLIALSAITSNARAADLQLQSIDVQTLSGQQVQLKFHLSGPAPEPMPFTIDKPARIAFDLPNTALALASRRIDVRSGGVDSVLAAEANGRTRVVVNVDSLLPYPGQSARRDPFEGSRACRRWPGRSDGRRTRH
jgi:type IV pilus assembly protein PilQ